MENRDLAMQTRCPTCLGEQYGATVLQFSNGKHGCTCCGRYTEPMSQSDWYLALARARRARAKEQR